MTKGTGSKAGRKPGLSDAQLADRLAGGAGVLAFRRLADGGLVIVNGRGQKRTYSAQEVGNHDAGQ